MNIKIFLTVLKSTLVEKYPDLKIYFYVSRRNRCVHMGLDQALHSILNFEKIINEMESIWTVRKHDNKFVFVYPELIHSVMWKYDYLII